MDFVLHIIHDSKATTETEAQLQNESNDQRFYETLLEEKFLYIAVYLENLIYSFALP